MAQLPDPLPGTFMDRWEELKPIIEQLWLMEKKKLADVVFTMRSVYIFDALEHQYKYQFKKWKWKRNISSTKKKQIVEQLESRARAGKPGTSIILYGREVEPHKMRRHMKTQMREQTQNMILQKPLPDSGTITRPVLPFANSFFLKWNMPYAAMRRSFVRPLDHASPGFAVPTPGSDINVATPSSAASPQNAASPNTLLAVRKLASQRAQMFVQGQHEKLFVSLNSEEKRIMSDWLYQYWLFCFKTAKDFGTGRHPHPWTADLLDFDRFSHHPGRSLPGTPGASASTPEAHIESFHGPIDHCRWFVHVYSLHYDRIEEEEVIVDLSEQDVPKEASLPVQLRDGLEHNDFSSISTAVLPVAVPQIAKAAEKSPDELLLESFGFSIMSRNFEQVDMLLRRMRNQKIDFGSIFPLHIATNYLDGYTTCCEIFRLLLL